MADEEEKTPDDTTPDTTPDPLNDELVRRFLHRLKKLQVNEGLDRLYLQKSNVTLLVPPTTRAQMNLVRSFFTHVILSSLEIVIDDLKEKEKEDTPPENPAASTTTDEPAATETTTPGHAD